MTDCAQALASHYLTAYPNEAARTIDTLPEAAVTDLLTSLEPPQIVPVLNALPAMLATPVLMAMPKAIRKAVIEKADRNRAVPLLGQMSKEQREGLYAELPAALSAELRMMLEYPDGTAGRLMDTVVFSLPGDTTVERALELLRQRDPERVHFIKLLDNENRLSSLVDVRQLAFSAPETRLTEISRAVVDVVSPMDPREDVVRKFEEHDMEELPVIDVDGRILGLIRHSALVGALKTESTLDIQTMVGVSKDERALSPSWFALRKRMPWMQINLLTAFLAASVVGLFENTIATFTALAVLLPVVAGQSGNAGAQALAVTMRGLALREITIGQWFRVLRKELNVGFWNGLAIALTCGIGVFFWSGSIGLVLVIALSMVIAMVAAGIAGALVPIVLSRLGQDPAVASSIILTTVTDVAGFFSFLGIATILSGML
ncbi:magnesium transporter [Nisaea nitritireducens]|uniref:magnesium transporter n=1 Tax=Nisaea nitritireducens TaxID=568392 RepID=UPI001868C3A8|nr:magnesium transporter [Nisaea nitritireducens]